MQAKRGTFHPGPKKTDRIGIIGAGVAGTHMASLLLKAGYSKVIVLEKSDRHGGKCYTVTDADGVPHELGACKTRKSGEVQNHLLSFRLHACGLFRSSTVDA